jgi:streptogrisin C
MPGPLVRAAVLATVTAAMIVTGATAATGTATATVTPMVAADAGAQPEVLAAMRRDLGLGPASAAHRLAAESVAASTRDALRAALGSAYGGAWFDAGRMSLVVGVTNPAQDAVVRAAGAIPHPVARTEAELSKLESTLDARARAAPAGVTGWYVDEAADTVVLDVLDEPAGRQHPSARAFGTEAAMAAGLPPSAVRLRDESLAPRPLLGLVGGDPLYFGGARCSIAFSANGPGGRYVITAGHCTKLGGSVLGLDRAAVGIVSASSFPTNDYGAVRVTSDAAVSTAAVRTAATTYVTVSGSAPAPPGSSVCRAGSTTGWHCGTVQATQQTVMYPEGMVRGLTRTDVCAEPGDSGGSFVSGRQAQGITSGGAGNCTGGGTTFFEPIAPVLSVLMLNLAVIRP